MKKLLSLLAIICTVVVFTSCEKKNDSPQSVVGTVWERNEYVFDLNVVTTLSFSANEFKYKEVIESSVTAEITGPYIYDSPNVVLNPESAASMNGKINGTVMTLTVDGITMKLKLIAQSDK